MQFNSLQPIASESLNSTPQVFRKIRYPIPPHPTHKACVVLLKGERSRGQPIRKREHSKRRGAWKSVHCSSRAVSYRRATWEVPPPPVPFHSSLRSPGLVNQSLYAFSGRAEKTEHFFFLRRSALWPPPLSFALAFSGRRQPPSPDTTTAVKSVSSLRSRSVSRFHFRASF